MKVQGTPAVGYGRMFAIRNAAPGLGPLRLDTVTNPQAHLKLNVAMDVVDAVACVASGIRRDVASAHQRPLDSGSHVISRCWRFRRTPRPAQAATTKRRQMPI
jgi:hypothetical protein